MTDKRTPETGDGQLPEQLRERVELDPRLREDFDRIDALFDGLEGDERRKALQTFYFDADGRPQSRSRRLHAVPDEEN